MTETQPVDLMAKLIDSLASARVRLRAAEELEHPPITDRFGRVWTWKDDDLYVHDGLLAWPLDGILSSDTGLPSSELADNPNYAGLCEICTREWPV